MKRSRILSTWLVVLILLLIAPAAGVAVTKVRKESFVSQNKKHSYYLFVPENLKTAAPVLILLHGSNRDGNSLVDKWQDLAEKEQIILAGLNSLDSSRWNLTEDGPEVIRDLVEQLKSNYPVDARRVYVFGHSGGAVYAIMLSLMESEYFAAAAVHAGSLRSAEELKAVELARRKIPLAIWVGDRDPYFSVASVRATAAALTSKGCPVEVTEMPGHDHWYYDLAPRINEAAWQFLKKHSLSSDARYQAYTKLTGEGAKKAVADINATLAEINQLKTTIHDLIDQANARETTLNARDLLTDRAEINKAAREEIDLVSEAAALSRAAAAKAAQVDTSKLGDKYRKYFGLVARHNNKYADMLDVIREQAELLLTSERNDVITQKRAECRKRIEALRQEAEDLYKQAAQLVQ